MIPRRAFAGSARPPRLAGGGLNRPWQIRSYIAPVPSRTSLPNGSSRRFPAFTQTKRLETTITGDQKSGHIYSGPNESILFFDNLYPLKLTSGLLRWAMVGRYWKTDEDLANLLKGFDKSSLGMMDPVNLIKRTIPDDGSMKVTELIPRLKDGGCFVKVSHTATPADEIEGKLSKQLEKQPIKPWFNPFRGIKVGLVNGVPWLEDMARYPQNRLKIEFIPKEPGGEVAELSQENLFALFRKYGKITDIVSQPSDSKVVPKYAFLDYAFTRDAIMARNCLHGIIVPENLGGGKTNTVLRLSYEQKARAHHIWNWISNHPRIVIPILAALLAGISVLIFDPIREFFIEAHIQKRFSLSDNKIYQWFKRRTNDILAFRKIKSEDAGLKALFTHRRDAIDQIQRWLMESADTFIVVQGPRGSGKEELVLDQALAGRKDVLVIDCKPIVEAKGESTTIKKLAGEVGYRPVFSWANQLSSLIDLAIQGTTGVKSGFSETLDSQLSKILANTAAALKKVSLSDRKKDGADANLNDDAFLEAHPERRTVVVIENFLLKNEETSIVYDKLSEWAAALVQSNIAHVVFLTSDSSYSKPLSKSLPDRVFRTIALGDLSPDIAKQYVLSHLTQTKPKDKYHSSSAGKNNSSEASNNEQKSKLAPADADPNENPKSLQELDEVIDVLGGRLTDLEFLARRMKTGQSPRQAVQEIIDQSASEIIKLFLLTNRAPGDDGRKYSTEQAWYLIKEIAKKESLRYNEVLLSNTFASSTTPGVDNGELALEGLANAELISVRSHRGRPQTISAGKPVYQAAFDALLKDPVLKAKMDLVVLTELGKIEGKTIEKVESELSLLASLPKQPYETTARINYLLKKLSDSQTKIKDFETEMAKLKMVLMKEA